MRTIALILAAMGLASAGVIPIAPLVGQVATQHHAQDELGQYSYGYSGGPSSKQEVRSADGITQGGYSFVDGNGLVQSAAYISDAVNGFRVAATNLPSGPAVPVNNPIVAPAVEILSSQPAVVASRVAVAPVLPPSTIAQPALSSISVQRDAVPVKENQEEESEAPVISGQSESTQEASQNESAPAQVVEATVQQLIAPVQDTPEVQAAKAAHLAAFEEVQIRDAAQEVHDAQENTIAAKDGNSEENREEDNEGEEPTEATEEGTEETPASEAAPETEVSPTPDVALEASPVITPSVVTTQLVAAAPVEPASMVIPSVLTKEVVPVATVRVAIPETPLVANVAAPAVLVGSPAVHTPSGPVALEHVGQITAQYHAQDELGQYSYGYSGGPSAKHEVKTADGLTSGGYSYIDSHGLVQTAAYLSDPVNGFRVAASNIPLPRQPEYIRDSPEVEEAKQQLFRAQAEHIAKL